MHNQVNELEPIRDIPVVSAIRIERSSKYGGVLGLDDDELADSAELERLVMWGMWGPLLALRPQKRVGHVPYAGDGSGVIDWEAVGTVTVRRPVREKRDVALSTRRICQLLEPRGVLRVRVARRTDSPTLPERPEEYPDYDDLVECGLLPGAKVHPQGAQCRTG